MGLGFTVSGFGLRDSGLGLGGYKQRIHGYTLHTSTSEPPSRVERFRALSVSGFRGSDCVWVSQAELWFGEGGRVGGKGEGGGGGCRALRFELRVRASELQDFQE